MSSNSVIIKLGWSVFALMVVISSILAGAYVYLDWDTGPTLFVSPPEKISAGDSPELRGKKLRGAIDWTYSKMKKENKISYDPARTETVNNIAPIIKQYIASEISLSDAKVILHSAGFGGWSFSTNHLGEREAYASIDKYAGVPFETISVVVILSTQASKVTKIKEAYFSTVSLSDL